MTIALLLLLAPLLLANLVLSLETFTGLPSGRPSTRTAMPRQVVVVVPAHNEAAGLERSLTALKAALPGPSFSILVVADNCTDDTAAIARTLGVPCTERHDLAQKGKGFALAHARDSLRRQPPDAVIVLDADCRTDSASLQALASACLAAHGPCQAVNLLEPAPHAPSMVQISSFAFLLKNLVRQRGLQRLAGGVHLTGTGMCLPWRHFEMADLATASIVEDIRLGIELGRQGFRPQLIEDAVVWSPHSEVQDTLTQRGRWEGGFLAMAARTAPGLILEGLRRRDLRTVMSGLDLIAPPLAMLALMNLAGLLLTIAPAAAGWTSVTPALVLALTAALAGIAVLLAWWREGRRFLTPAALLKLPLYALWKVPMYLGLARRGAPREWARTRRSPERGSGAPPRKD